ncbi:hypothetical protein HJC23_005496, partial [Cyclotella cryptica]
TTTAAIAASAVLGVAILAYHQGKRRGRNEVVSRSTRCDISRETSSSESDACLAVVATDKDNHRIVKANDSTLPFSQESAASIPSTDKTMSNDDDFDMLPIYPIGTLRSIYRLCVGTPRQGMLAPHSRGIITFHEHLISKDSILELQNFSHVFVVFVFHLNSNTNVRRETFGKDASSSSSNDNTQRSSANSSNDKAKHSSSKRQFPSKIAPPSLGGKKVGVFSTRTPHRPNPIGFSLCKLDKVLVDTCGNGSGNKGTCTFSLLVSGLDIVDGTPILDIKPYVPHYDCVGYNPGMRMSDASEQVGNDEFVSTRQSSEPNSGEDTMNNAVKAASMQGGSSEESDVRVPYWVDSGLQKRRTVTFLPDANLFLQHLISPPATNSSNHATPSLNDLQFYGPNSPWKDSPVEAVEYLRNCMHELLGVDVRSTWQTKKARKGKFQAERSTRVKSWKEDDDYKSDAVPADASNPLCTQQIDNLLLKYTIEEPGSSLLVNDVSDKRYTVDERSKGSGAEDIVVVHSISFINTKHT